MAMQSTLALIKPSGIKRGIDSPIFRLYNQSGLTVVDVKVIQPDVLWWVEFYYEHMRKPFFRDLINFMTSGVSLAIFLEGERAVKVVRDINGATDPKQAATLTIRHRYAFDSVLPDNVVHGSASAEDAERELKLVFGNGLKFLRPHVTEAR